MLTFVVACLCFASFLSDLKSRACRSARFLIAVSSAHLWVFGVRTGEGTDVSTGGEQDASVLSPTPSVMLTPKVQEPVSVELWLDPVNEMDGVEKSVGAN